MYGQGQGVMYYPQFAPPPALEGPALVSAIKTQVEYYFSTNNLVKDVFLRSQMNPDGFIPVSCICGFKRMQTLSSSADVIKDAVADSTTVRHRFLRSAVVGPQATHASILHHVSLSPWLLVAETQ
jgi:la-related protein 1